MLRNNTGQMNPGMHLDFKIPTRSCKGPLRAFIVLVSVCFIRSVGPFMTDSESRTSDETGIYGGSIYGVVYFSMFGAFYTLF